MLPKTNDEMAINGGATRNQTLAAAFTTFIAAAKSLEASYGHLQSEVGRLRRQLEQANHELMRERELSQQRQALAEIGGMLAHEVRNPLGVLELLAGLLHDSPDIQGENRRYLGQMISGLRLMTATINNVLRLHADVPPDLTPIKLADVAESTLDFIRPMAEQASVTVEFHDSLGDIPVPADPNSVRQVLHNLTLNAIRSMRGGGVVSITTGLLADGDKRTAEMRVADTGPGIANDLRTRIFEPGFSTRAGGVGLGLAVCRKIMQQHGGAISLADSDRGATFVLRFRLQ